MLGFFPVITYADEVLYLEVIVNGQNSGRIAQFIRKENDWEVSYRDLASLGIKLDIPVKDNVLLSEISGTNVIYDSELQRLFLTVPINMLPTQYLKANVPQRKDNQAHRDSGLFVNYNLTSINGNMAPRMSSLWHEVNIFADDVSIVSTGIAQNNGDSQSQSGYTRFETYYQRDDENGLQTRAIGDVINATPNWGRSIRMGGIRIARDYELDPTLITYPLPEFYGESALPGSVELIINNQLRWRDQVASGPFFIDTVPYMSGAGVAQVITTNVQGQQVRQAVNFYVTSELLSPGMFDYDITTGFRRKDFGLLSDSYAERPVISSSFRYGLNRNVSPQFLMQWGEGLRLGGAGLTFLAGNAGVFDVAASASDYRDEHGQQASFSYNYLYRKIGINARYLRHYGDYRDLGNIDDESGVDMGFDGSGVFRAARDTQLQVAFSIHDERLGGFNFGYFKLVDDDDKKSAVVNVSWNRYLYSSATAFINFSRQLYGRRENLASLTISIPFGNRGQVSGVVQRDMNGELNNQVQATSTAPYAGGLGWSLGIDDSAAKNRFAMANWRAKYAELTATSYKTGDQKQYSQSINGALVVMDHDVYPTHFVADSFALVDATKSNVPVMIGHELIGHTDSRGKLLVPDLNSYLENRVSIDPGHLPANAAIESIEQLIIPRRNGGVHVKFPITFLQSALVEVFMPNNEPIPAGAVLSTRGAERTFVAGWDGEIYIENLSEPLTLFWDEGECIVEIKPASDKSIPMPRLGPFTCELATGAP